MRRLIVVELTEPGLGGSDADPPSLRGRAANGFRRWSYAAVEREVAFTLARGQDPENAVRPAARWDTGQPLAFPALRRLMVKTPETAKTLPASLGPRPGTRYIEASGAAWHGSSLGRTVVALDSGGDLAGWRDLHWIDTSTGDAVRVTTNPREQGALVVESLDERATLWSRAPQGELVEVVVVDPDLITHLGRVSGVIDADSDGLGDLRARRPLHRDANRLAAVQKEAKRIGPRPFARRTGLPLKVAERAARGRPISAGSVDRALRSLSSDGDQRVCIFDGCGALVEQPNAVYCGKSHRDAAYRARRNAKAAAQNPDLGQPTADPFAGLPTCMGCDTVLLGDAAERGTCAIHKEGS
jgi:hypothetical protein